MPESSAHVFYAVSNDPRQCIDADVRALADHLRRCVHGRSRWLWLRSGVQTLRGFTRPRIMSALLLCAIIVGAVSLAG